VPLADFDPANWNSVDSAFQGVSPIALGQPWQEETQSEFLPGEVRIGFSQNALWVYAELEDVDIFNPLRGDNEKFFHTGDAFEIFLRPVGQTAYYEFHVGPDNQQFRLRIPSKEAFVNQTRETGEQMKIADRVIRSWVRLEPDANRWRVLAEIPFDAVIEEGGSKKEWDFSFCRYDYTQGKKRPILSSSSPLTEMKFHTLEQWGRLEFQFPPDEN